MNAPFIKMALHVSEFFFTETLTREKLILINLLEGKFLCYSTAAVKKEIQYIIQLNTK